MSRVEQFERIRQDRELEGLSIRGLAERHGVHRRTVRQALASALPPERKAAVRVSPSLGAYQRLIREWLVADLDAPKKQRHTARRVWQRLVDEHHVVVSESTVRAHVAMVRKELAGGTVVVTIAQIHPPGAHAEVDFGEFTAWIDGVKTKLWMFAMRLSSSGRAYHQAFSTQAQEAFLEGHVRAFTHFGGVPTGQIRYDNLKPAVARVLLGRDRIESDRFIALRSHYRFESFFCTPGIEGAHEKGGIEGEIGRFRRNHLVPVPKVASLAELNMLIAAAGLRDDDRHIDSRRVTVGAAFATESGLLKPLPDEHFDCAVILRARVDSKARVCVRSSFYSVPARFARSAVTVRLYAQRLEILAAGKVVAEHERSMHHRTETLVLDHYLEVLTRKPGAFAGSVVLDQACNDKTFTTTHEQYWVAARNKHGDNKGTHALIDVLLLHRRLPNESVLAGMIAALTAGTIAIDVVACEARRHHEHEQRPLIEIVVGGLERYDRPLPVTDQYDTLLKTGT